MKTAYTPGPWHINDGFEISGTVIASGGHESRKVCTVWTDWRNGIDNIPIETKKANARLIAAAPELLEACYALSVFFGTYNGDGSRRVLDQARAAIARATGGQE